MADIVMVQIPGTTHHYRALIDVDPGNLTPTIDLAHYRDVGGNLYDMLMSIQDDPRILDIIEAEFEAQTTSVRGCVFDDASYKKIVSPSGQIIEHTIGLIIDTTAIVLEVGAIEMKFEFLHSLGR